MKQRDIAQTLPTTHDRRQIEQELAKATALQAMALTISDAPVIAAPIEKPLNECRIAIVASTGVHLKSEKPFVITGDPSYRIIPRDADYNDLQITHVRYPNQAAHEDLDCVYPLQTLRDFAAEGIIKDVAPRNFGMQGHMPRVDVIIGRSAPEVADMLVEDDVDIAILSPG